MSPREKSFWWKIGYLGAMATLLALLYWLGAPATGEDAGGKLARLRDDYKLSQKLLGDLHASSETIKLATFGLRGVAANILWGKAHVYKKKKDWTNLEATVNQITALQPNFIEIWKFQGWNLAYNVSAEFDGFRDRYHYVIKGINFLRDGIEYNSREPRLLWEVGWIVSQKMGRSDETKQFRRLFKEDDDFHASLPFVVRGPDPRDSWLVGKEWFRRATDLVDSKGYPMKGKGPLLYRSSAPMCQMNYAAVLEDEGRFGSVAQQAWKDAAREWFHYGSADLDEMIDDAPVKIQLNDLDRGKNYLAQIDRIEGEIRDLEPGLRETIVEERRAELTDEQREALDIPAPKRTGKQIALAAKAEETLAVTDEDVAKRISDPTNRARAAELMRDLRTARRMADLIQRRREIVNFAYWRLRADVEQTDEAVAAHEWIYLGDQDVVAGRLESARQNFDNGLAAWRKLLDAFPEALAEETFGEDLIEVIDRYRKLLALRDEKQQRDATFAAQRPLANLGLEFQDTLDQGVVSDELRRALADQNVQLSDDATIKVEEPGERWSITDRAMIYTIVKQSDALSLAEQFILADVVQRYGQAAAGK